MNASGSNASESRHLKAHALVALAVALGAWIALYIGYSAGSVATLLVGAAALAVSLVWLLAALVIGYVRERSS